jgi:hypothetical protein
MRALVSDVSLNLEQFRLHPLILMIFSLRVREEPSVKITNHFTEASHQSAELDKSPYTFQYTHMSPPDFLGHSISDHKFIRTMKGP